jgi:uncharacterized protein (TIRG00374 family)
MLSGGPVSRKRADLEEELAVRRIMKKTITLAVKIGVSLALYAYIFRKVDVGMLWHKTKTADPAYVLSAILIYFLVQVISAYRWYVLLTPLGIKVPFRRVLSLYFVGMYGNLFLPGSIGGDFVRVYYLNKEAGTLTGATTTVFLDRNLGLAALLMIAVISAGLAGTRFNGVSLAPIFGAILIAFVATNLALFYRPSYNLLHKALKLFNLKRSDEKVERLFASFNSYRGSASVIAVAILLSVVIQIGGVVVNMAAGAGVDLHTDRGFIDYLVFIPAISLISMIPLSINGMGWREGAYIVLFTSAGGEKPSAAMLALLWLVVLLVTGLPGGLIYAFQGMNRKGIRQKSDPGVQADSLAETDRQRRNRLGVAETDDLKSETV